jgi:uncharacterized damage-inducible protein DinB
MRRTFFQALLIILVLAGTAFSAYGQAHSARRNQRAAPTGVRAEMLAQLDEAEEKLVALAQAVPPEKYSWRPQKGVRSISEVYMHVADGTCRLLRNVDFEPPKVLDDDYLEKITDKEKVLELMKLAFQHARNAIVKMPETSMNKRTLLMGKNLTYRGVLLMVVTHMHEHLGQSIAYARLNDIVPPWTLKEQQKEKEQAEQEQSK